MFDKLSKKGIEFLMAFRNEYGVLALFASAAVVLKLLFFYRLIGVEANFILVWLITCLFTYLLFSSIKNKWIPAVIYLLLTILMLCDVTYSSFFNRYLSVNMLGAAGVLGDITESIKEVLKPKFFLLLADSILIFAALFARKMKKEENADLDSLESTPDSDRSVLEAIDLECFNSEKTNLENIDLECASETGEIVFITDFDQLEELEEKEAAEATETINKAEEFSNQEQCTSVPVQNEAEQDDLLRNSVNRRTRSKRRKQQKNLKQKTLLWMRQHKRPLTGVLLLLVLTFNISGSYLITSISNQEIYSYHLKDIMGAVTGNSSNIGANYMYDFTDSYQTEKNGPLFGVAKNKNLIVIQIESLQNFVINREYNGQEITPNLNQLLKENTIYFDNYYQQIGSGNTSDAEFATNNSIYGTLSSFTYKLYDHNYFRGLPVLLKEQGYESAVYHAHEDRNFWNRQDAYSAIGFDTYVGGIEGSDKGQYDMTEWMGWGLTDSEFFQQTMEYLKKMPEPFYSFIITLSNHHPYIMMDKYNFIDILPEDKDTIVGNYINSAAYTDYALGQLFQQLKDEGLYENSIIALYGDHMGLTKTDEEIHKSMSKILGKDYDFDTMMNIPLIISVPGAEQNIQQTVSVSGGQLDFLPTIAYLMGFDSLDTIYLGHNLLTIDSGFVAEQTYMTKGSFFQDDIVYEMSRDGVFENGRAWNKKTGESVPVKDCYEGYLRSMGLINTSEYMLKNDVLRKVYLEGQDTLSAFSHSSSIEYPDEIALAGAPDMNLLGTNSLEALNASYEAGYRNLKVQVCWTEDKEAVLLSTWKELSRYFDTDKSSEVTLEVFHNLNMVNGLTSMDFLDLISWVREHPDATILAEVERSPDYFMKCMESYAGSILNQFIVEVPGIVEYSGLYNSILNVDTGGNTAEQIIEYIQMNQVPSIVMSRESAAGIYKKVLDKADCETYIVDNNTGIITKTSL